MYGMDRSIRVEIRVSVNIYEAVYNFNFLHESQCRSNGSYLVSKRNWSNPSPKHFRPELTPLVLFLVEYFIFYVVHIL